MSTPFSASDPAIGYLYQLISYALYVILNQPGKQDAHIRLEKLDDIEICEGDTPRESIQVKHTEVNLSNRNENFWKTIRVWSENCSQGLLKLPETVLTLATTAKAPEGSIASLLRLGTERHVEQALKRMQDEAEQTTETLAPAFSAFKALSPYQQRNLVGAIQIFDNAPNIDEVGKQTAKLFVGVHDEYQDSLYEDLSGWWLKKVVEHLRNESKYPISRSSVLTKIADLNDKYKTKKLQDPYIDESLPANYDVDGRTFVLQMKLINLSPEMIRLAKRDFYCVGKSRAWLVDEVCIQELTSYDQRLKDEWLLCVNEVRDQQNVADCDEFEQRKIGRAIYWKVKDINVHIHPELFDVRYTRGSYHILADAAGIPDVGWHPHFKTLLDEIFRGR